jgi:hypothetical protein
MSFTAFPFNENGNESIIAVSDQIAAFVGQTIGIDAGEVGVLFATVCAADENGNDMTGSKMVRYKKSAAGVLTVGTVVNVLPVVVGTGMAGCTFNLVSNGNGNIDVTLTPPTAQKETTWTIVIDPRARVSKNLGIQ